MAPLALDHVVKKCLDKAPEDSWQSAGDLASELKWVAEASSQALSVFPPRSPFRNARWWLVAMLMLLLLGMLGVFWARLTRSVETVGNDLTRLSIPLPAKQELAADVTEALPLSPDGHRIAVVIRIVQQLEVLDRDRGTVTNIVSNLNSYFAPAWLSDGKAVLIDGYNASRQRGIYRVSTQGNPDPQLLKQTPHISHVTSIAGPYAAVMVNDPVTNTDLWLLTLRHPNEMLVFKQTPAVERQGSLSPDARWIAYASNDSGRSEIYVELVPGPGGRKQISSEGGEQPRWVRSAREIVYRNGTKMMSVMM